MLYVIELTASAEKLKKEDSLSGCPLFLSFNQGISKESLRFLRACSAFSAVCILKLSELQGHIIRHSAN
jgi:hypothetical protein